jgi:hypothetical protein
MLHRSTLLRVRHRSLQTLHCFLQHIPCRCLALLPPCQGLLAPCCSLPQAPRQCLPLRNSSTTCFVHRSGHRVACCSHIPCFATWHSTPMRSTSTCSTPPNATHMRHYLLLQTEHMLHALTCAMCWPWMPTCLHLCPPFCLRLCLRLPLLPYPPLLHWSLLILSAIILLSSLNMLCRLTGTLAIYSTSAAVWLPSADLDRISASQTCTLSTLSHLLSCLPHVRPPHCLDRPLCCKMHATATCLPSTLSCACQLAHTCLVLMTLESHRRLCRHQPSTACVLVLCLSTTQWPYRQHQPLGLHMPTWHPAAISFCMCHHHLRETTTPTWRFSHCRHAHLRVAHTVLAMVQTLQATPTQPSMAPWTTHWTCLCPTLPVPDHPPVHMPMHPALTLQSSAHTHH